MLDDEFLGTLLHEAGDSFAFPPSGAADIAPARPSATTTSRSERGPGDATGRPAESATGGGTASHVRRQRSVRRSAPTGPHRGGRGAGPARGGGGAVGWGAAPPRVDSSDECGCRPRTRRTLSVRAGADRPPSSAVAPGRRRRRPAGSLGDRPLPAPASSRSRRDVQGRGTSPNPAPPGPAWSGNRPGSNRPGRSISRVAKAACRPPSSN